jgi:hypothetical protein
MHSKNVDNERIKYECVSLAPEFGRAGLRASEGALLRVHHPRGTEIRCRHTPLLASHTTCTCTRCIWTCSCALGRLTRVEDIRERGAEEHAAQSDQLLVSRPAERGGPQPYRGPPPKVFGCVFECDGDACNIQAIATTVNAAAATATASATISRSAQRNKKPRSATPAEGIE